MVTHLKYDGGTFGESGGVCKICTSLVKTRFEGGKLKFCSEMLQGLKTIEDNFWFVSGAQKNHRECGTTCFLLSHFLSEKITVIKKTSYASNNSEYFGDPIPCA